MSRAILIAAHMPGLAPNNTNTGAASCILGSEAWSANHSPVKTGLRFSANARSPSEKSCTGMVCALINTIGLLTQQQHTVPLLRSEEIARLQIFPMLLQNYPVESVAWSEAAYQSGLNSVQRKLATEPSPPTAPPTHTHPLPCPEINSVYANKVKTQIEQNQPCCPSLVLLPVFRLGRLKQSLLPPVATLQLKKN